MLYGWGVPFGNRTRVAVDLIRRASCSRPVAGRVIVGRTERRLHQTLRAAVPHPTLFLSLQPGETLAYGRRSYALRPDRAVFSAAGHEYTRTGGSSESLVVRVESGLLEREIAARGQALHEFVTARRLAAARRRLESASSPVRVSTVALDCGFAHFGRFADSYRAAFGESPVETVRSGERSLRGVPGEERTWIRSGAR